MSNSQLGFFSKHVFFTTRQYAFFLDTAMETASRQLKTLTDEKSMVQVTRGVWAQVHHPHFSPFGAVPLLLGKEHGYISFVTALHRHGVISQIPNNIQVATTGRGRVLSSPIGEYEFFHLQPPMMRVGIQASTGKLVYNIASPEKALIDALYLATRKGRRFSRLPEIETESLQVKEIKRLLKHLPSSVQKFIRPNLPKILCC